MRSWTSAALAAGLLAAGALAFAGAARADGDAAKGEKAFAKCRACHSVKAGENKVGPSLAGVVGRKAGSVEGFKYSDAMKNAGVTWDGDTLEKYLKNPKEFIPGNKMVFPGIKKDDEIDDIVAYLKTAS